MRKISVIERIKKAKLYLSKANQKSSAKFKRGEYYKFVIEDIRNLSDNSMYYILSGDLNKKYLLKYKYYKNHNFSIGQAIECTIIKYSSKGYYILEPRHPFYEIEDEYDFEFVKQKKDAKGEITGNFDVTVKDVFGEDVKFMSERSLLVEGAKPEKIQCKVSGVKKGKPLLDI